MKAHVLLGLAFGAAALTQLPCARAASTSPSELLSSSAQYRQPAVPSAADFAGRCASAGVILCDPMDTAPVQVKGIEAGKKVPCRTLTQAVGPRCKYRSWRWIGKKAGSPIVDQETLADGSGSLRLTFPSNSGAGWGGYYNTNFSPDLLETFGEGEPFFVQFRVRFSCERIWMDCDPASSGYKSKRRTFAKQGGGVTAFKIAIIEVGDVPGAKYPSNHCETTQVVLNHSLDHSWAAFHSCGWYTAFDMPLEYKPLGSRQTDRQPVNSNYVNWPVKSLEDADRTQQCLRLIPDPWRKSTWGDSDPNCLKIDSDVWYTVTQQVVAYWQPRRKGTRRSLYRLWVQADSGPTQLVVEHNFYNRGPEAQGKAYGKIILLQHSTGKDANEKHPVGYVWYDSVIVSREMIPPAL